MVFNCNYRFHRNDMVQFSFYKLKAHCVFDIKLDLSSLFWLLCNNLAGNLELIM